MKKTTVLTNTAIVFFIISLVFLHIYEYLFMYWSSGLTFGFVTVANELLFSSAPLTVSIILLIIGAKKASLGKSSLQYRISIYLLTGTFLIHCIEYFMFGSGVDITRYNINKVEYFIRTLLLLFAFIFIAFDAYLLKKNKAIGIVGASLIIVVAVFFLSYYTINSIPSLYRNFEHVNNKIDLFDFIFYGTFLLFLGIGFLLYIIGRQSKDSEQLPPASLNGGGFQQRNYPN